MNWFVRIKDFCVKFYLIAPCFYTFLNYFFVIEKEQRWTPMGWAWLVVSIIYFVIALYFIIKNW